MILARCGTPKIYTGLFRQLQVDNTVNQDFHYVILCEADKTYNGHWVYFDKDFSAWRDGGLYGSVASGGGTCVLYTLEKVGSQLSLVGSDGSGSSVLLDSNGSGSSSGTGSGSGSSVTVPTGPTSMRFLQKCYRTSSGSESSFALPSGYANGNLVLVFVNGMKLTANDYSIVGNQVILNQALDVINTSVELIVLCDTEVG